MFRPYHGELFCMEGDFVMSVHIPCLVQEELSPGTRVSLEQVKMPQYGRYLEDFEPGFVFQHPRGFTIDRGWARAFATSYMETNPMYFNVEYAKRFGFPDTVVCPQLVFNLILSMGVQNDSEKAIANLGYYHARFLYPVYPGDTLTARTRVVSRKDRGEGQPGIVHIQTLGLNQHQRVVMQYERKIMVGPRPPEKHPVIAPEPIEFPWQTAPAIDLPLHNGPYPSALTAGNTYAEHFQPGDIIVHPNGRTVTNEHVWWSYGVGNTHPLHNDRIYSTGLQGAMSGEPIVYGGLVFAWLQGLASRDVTENALWDMGFTEGYHTQPTVTGDTLAAISRILSIQPCSAGIPASIVTLQLIGVKNISAAQALSTYGTELFEKENDKRKHGKDKIAAKVFEVERQILLRTAKV